MAVNERRSSAHGVTAPGFYWRAHRLQSTKNLDEVTCAAVIVRMLDAARDSIVVENTSISLPRHLGSTSASPKPGAGTPRFGEAQFKSVPFLLGSRWWRHG